jgi:hypothetical protein
MRLRILLLSFLIAIFAVLNSCSSKKNQQLAPVQEGLVNDSSQDKTDSNSNIHKSSVDTRVEEDHRSRWKVKTLTDVDAAWLSRYGVYPQEKTDIASILRSAIAKRDRDAHIVTLHSERFYEEEKVAVVSGYLNILNDDESDGDMHLTISDNRGNNLVAEVPDPEDPTVKGTKYAAEFAGVRSFVKDHRPFTDLHVTMAGVVFFDPRHLDSVRLKPHKRMTQVWRVELHPVLGIREYSEREGPSE